MKTYLVLSHVEIQNANAISSNYIIGFPAMTAWMGGVHALERKIRCFDDFKDISFCGTGIVVHKHYLHAHRLQGNIDNSLFLVAHPQKLKGKRDDKCEPASFIPEGRIDLNVSLVVEVSGFCVDKKDDFRDAIRQILPTMRLAGGDVINHTDKLNVEVVHIDNEEPERYSKLVSMLMPGYAILERRDLLLECSSDEAGNKYDAMDRLLELLQVNEVAELDDSGMIIKWNGSRKKAGWLVPIAVGYKALSPAGKVLNQRDSNYDHRFVEPVVTIGEFKPLYRIKNMDALMWQYKYENDLDLYVCVNQNM